MSLKRNNIFICLLLINLIFFSCNKKEQDTGLFTKNIEVDGVNYAIYIPKDIENTSVSLVFELHGGDVYIEDMTGEDIKHHTNCG